MRKQKFATKIQKAVALGLVSCMTVSMAACGSSSNSNGTTSSEGTASGESSTDSSSDATGLSYTYNYYLEGSPKTFNQHQWETANDFYIIERTTMGLYTFGFNEDRTNYEATCEMAASMPVDVTAEYAGNETYGVPSGETEGYAFTIDLNEAACWEDGTPINADTYIYSMQQLLNPEMKNYRASTYTSGSLTIANAGDYYSSNQEIYTDIASDDGYRDVDDSDMLFSLTQAVYFLGGSTGTDYYESDSSSFLDADGNDLYEKYSGEDYIALTDEAKADLLTISANMGDTSEDAYKEWCVTDDGKSASVDWDSVGLIKTGDYQITLVLEKPISEFYLLYNLSSNWLVYEELYEANKTQSGTLVQTSYGSSVDTYMSYGPYKLTEYQADKQITLEKNENWYGYTDGNHEGEYQTTCISTQIIDTQATALQLFLQGNLDYVKLTAEDMDTYRASDYILFTPESYTTKLTMNMDYDALKQRESTGINKTILSYIDFRQAISLCINRSDFAAQCTATHKAGFGLFNYNYICDPDTGELYRDSDQAKAALCEVYGVDDEDEITGYDQAKASELIQAAYEEALANGDISATDKVELEFLMYGNDDTYVKIFNFISDAITAAAEGTDLEGRISLTMTPDQDYYTHAKQGAYELILATWGGSSMDPYGIMECYASSTKSNEYGYDAESEEVTIEINGEEITKSFYDWYDALCNGEYANADSEVRTTILAKMEAAYLESYATAPLYYRTSASLTSRKVLMGTDTYVQIVEFGAERYMTYNFDDVSWDEYCAENGNQLSY